MVLFRFAEEEDIDNFISTFRSTNSIRLTSLHRDYLQAAGDPADREAARRFLAERMRTAGIDPVDRVKRLGQAWEKIEAAFIDRADSLFGVRATFWPVTAFCTINSRCRYSIEQSWFFVCMRSQYPMHYVMHELLHFYTWFYIRPRLLPASISDAAYNDFKESLTVLLNLEFSDLMDGAVDVGYPQHADLRAAIAQMWLRRRQLADVVAMYQADLALP